MGINWDDESDELTESDMERLRALAGEKEGEQAAAIRALITAIEETQEDNNEVLQWQ